MGYKQIMYLEVDDEIPVLLPTSDVRLTFEGQIKVWHKRSIQMYIE